MLMTTAIISKNASSFTATQANDAKPNDIHLRCSPEWIIQGMNHAYKTSAWNP